MVESNLVMLIIDDMEINRIILKKIFKDDYTIVEAENGLDALEKLNKYEDIAIILLDLAMPKMGGIEFLEVIKSNEKFCKIPVIVNTGHDQEDNEIRALDLGVDDFIVKPYNPRVVKSRIRNIVQKSILERREMERNLEDATTKLESLIDTVPGGIGIFEIISQQSVKVSYFNDGLCNLVKCTKDEFSIIAGSALLSFIYKDDLSSLIACFQESIRDDIPVKCTIRLVQNDGNLIWVSVNASKFKITDGHPIYHAVFTDMSEEKQAQQAMRETMVQLKYRAERDLLTGVYNRETFYKKTEEMLLKPENSNAEYELIRWNIERFKVVNDLFGSQIGDKVLIWLAILIENESKGVGTFGRLDADHFVTCCPKNTLQTDKIIKTLEEGLPEFNVNFPINVHIGIYPIKDNETAIDLMCDRASLALQTIKGNYLKHSAVYDASMRKNMIDEQELIAQMESALETRQFFINIQPIYSCKTCKPVSAEALIRWHHPSKGIISPGLFVPLFEKNGFITKLDMFVLEEVCKLIADAKREDAPMVPISVNLSRMNFYIPDLCQNILNLTKKYGVAPSMIKLEITESAYTDNVAQLLKAMKQFQENGFLIMMDDFGSGFSSLNMLKDVPVDVLKIDTKFIDDLENSDRAGSILSVVINMAKWLNMHVVAEGVETKNQFDFLKKIGCDSIQGYYFSKPLPVENFLKVIAEASQNASSGDVSKEDRKTILIAEDVELNRNILINNLEDSYNVIEVENGREALNILQHDASAIDIIITDIMMPVMDGFELLEKIHHSPFYAHIPVIVVTALNDAESKIRALESGAIDVFTKPFEAPLIRKRIENLLKLSATENFQSTLSVSSYH